MLSVPVLASSRIQGVTDVVTGKLFVRWPNEDRQTREILNNPSFS
jgi:hypothetical protein